MDLGLLLLVGIAVYVFLSFRIARENERFAVFLLGRFVGFKGPGLVFKLPGSLPKFARVALGDEGEILSKEVASFGSNPIPFKASAVTRVGSRVRVTGFEKAAVQVEALQQFVVCEKCGHKNAV